MSTVEEKDIPQHMLCVHCYSAEKCVTPVPCGHVIYCEECYSLIKSKNEAPKKCPVCSKSVASFLSLIVSKKET